MFLYSSNVWCFSSRQTEKTSKFKQNKNQQKFKYTRRKHNLEHTAVLDFIFLICFALWHFGFFAGSVIRISIGIGTVIYFILCIQSKRTVLNDSIYVRTHIIHKCEICAFNDSMKVNVEPRFYFNVCACVRVYFIHCCLLSLLPAEFCINGLNRKHNIASGEANSSSKINDSSWHGMPAHIDIFKRIW